MPKHERAHGVTVIAPPGVTVEDATRPRRSRAARDVAASAGTSVAADDLVSALAARGFERVGDFELSAAPQATRGRAAAPSARVEVDLADSEGAVVLVARDGVLSWVFSSVAPRRAARGVDAGGRRAVFEIDVPPRAAAPARGRRLARGPLVDAISGFVEDAVRAVVMKFVAGFAVRGAAKLLERNVRTGLVRVASTDPAAWERVAPGTRVLGAASGSPARVLLLVHGTFSSTIGTYGGLGATPWGRAFLEHAFRSYDVVLGYDHRTLSEDPLANADEMLAAVDAALGGVPARVDAVAFSRGALVLRSLVGRVAGGSAWRAAFEKVVFVGCTNAGTELARVENWHDLAELYTNLAVVSCRVLALFPQFTASALVLEELVQGVAALVKALATETAAGRGAPGLAAMNPAGRFIRTINAAAAGGPVVPGASYFAVTSDFEVTLGTGPDEFPKRLLALIADGFVDNLMKRADNDLVVNVASMAEIRGGLGVDVAGRFDFGANAQVYHTNYFVRPEVVGALSGWLGLLPRVPARRNARAAAPSIVAERRGARGGAPRRVTVDAGGREVSVEAGAAAVLPSSMDLVAAAKAIVAAPTAPAPRGGRPGGARRGSRG
jgi:hypothetical protein